MATSPRPYKRDELKSKGGDIFREKKDMVLSKDIEGARRQKIILWNTFFRRCPWRFIETYFQVKLFPFQVLMIWMLQRSVLAYFVMARAASKSWIISLWSLTLAVLYPGMEIIVCSKTIKQGSIILDKIIQMRDTYPNIQREIKNVSVGQNTNICYMQNGSTIKVVPSSESSRGNRANYIIVEESRLVPKEILEAIIKPFLYSRKPPYMLKDEYANIPILQEEGRISYITSAWFKSEYWWQYVKQTIKRMAQGDSTYNFLATDYLTAVFHGIKTKAMIESEKRDTDPLTFSLEYLNCPAGQSGKSYYRLNMFPRTVKKAWYPNRPENYGKKNPYDIKKGANELRVMSVDLATRANKADDLSSILIARLLATSRGYERNVMFMQTSHGESVIQQSLDIKRLYTWANCDFLVLDLAQVGIAAFEQLSAITHDDMCGVDYEGMTVMQHPSLDEKLIDELRRKTISLEAKEVIFPVVASQRSNSEMATYLRAALQKKLWNFLCTEADGEEYLLKTNKEFLESRDDFSMRPFFLAPYTQNDFLVSECINLDFSLVNGLIKLQEPSNSYKDRYVSLLYLNYFCHLLDQEILKETNTEDDFSVLSGVTFVM